MENHFYNISWPTLNVTIFIKHVRNCVKWLLLLLYVSASRWGGLVCDLWLPLGEVNWSVTYDCLMVRWIGLWPMIASRWSELVCDIWLPHGEVDWSATYDCLSVRWIGLWLMIASRWGGLVCDLWLPHVEVDWSVTYDCLT